MLLRAGFVWIRSKGSHRIYQAGARRVVVPFHAGATLHPKIAKEVIDAITESSTKQSDPA